MQQYTFHSGSAPAGTLTQVLVDGTHYCTYQVGLGYLDLDGFGVGTQEIKVFHDSLTPSITLTQVTLDGSHNGAFQVGPGYWRLWGYANDQGVIGKFLGGVLSFVGYPIRKLNSTFMVLFTTVLNLVGNVLNSTRQFISTPRISFRSDFFANPSTIQVIRIFFSSLINFTGAPIRQSRRIIGAILSFVGTFPRPVKSKILTAVLNFVGAFTKRTRRTVTGVVRFTISFVNHGKLFTANLFLSGVSIRNRGKIFAPVLSFVGVIKKFSPRTMASSLSFVTRLFHSIPTFVKSLTATLSFSGFLAAIRIVLRTLTAVVSFIGVITKSPRKTLTAATSFSGTFTKRGVKLFIATLSFVGTFITFRPGFQKALTATLSFSGSIVKSISKSIVATLSFVGRMVKQIPRLLTAALSFIGTFASVVPILKALSGTLSFAGNFLAQRVRLFTATLSFSGSITRRITRSFAATLSFVTKFVRARVAPSFTAALSFSGLVTTIKGKAKLFSAALSFSGSVVKRTRKSIAATLNFIGTLVIHSGPPIVFQVLIQGFLRFRTKILSRWFDAIIGISTTVREAATNFIGRIESRVFGRLEARYKLTEILEPGRIVQAIGTSPQLIDLSDFINPPPYLFIKNMDNEFFVEIDSSSSFNQFPQKIPPERGVLLSPDTTTIYARAIGFPVEIYLSPGQKPVTNKKLLTGGLSFAGSRVVPITFPQTLESTLNFREKLLPVDSLYLMKVTNPDFDNSYVSKDPDPGGPGVSEVWVSFGTRFPLSTVNLWRDQGDGWSGAFIRIFSSTLGNSIAEMWIHIDLTHLALTPNWYLYSNGQEVFSSGPPPPVPDTWNNCEMHIAVTTQTDVELYAQGVLVASVSSGNTDLIGRIESMGQNFSSIDGGEVYFRNVKMGSTRGGYDIFEDNFKTGDFSAWDFANGDCTTVLDPDLS